VLPLSPNLRGFPQKPCKNGAAKTLEPQTVNALNLALGLVAQF